MNAVITEADFRKRIKGGLQGQPLVYFFYGEEDYLKHNAIAVAKDALLDEMSVSFDSVSLGSAAYSAEALSSALASPPMFGSCKVVTVSVSLTDLRQGEVNDLLAVLEGASAETDGFNLLLINIPDGGFDPGLPKKPSPLFKKLAECAVPVLFERVSGPRLAQWVARHYAGRGASASADVCSFTVDHCGSDMFRLASEVDKISYFVLEAGRKEVTRDDVKKAGSTSVEFDTFALANAIAAGKSAAALEVLGWLRSQKTDPTRIMADIIRVFCDMTAVSACLEAGMTRQMISDSTGIKPYPLGRYIQSLESIRPEKLRRALELTRTADELVKGYGKDCIPIEQLICSV